MKKIVGIICVLCVASYNIEVSSKISYVQRGNDCVKSETQTIQGKGRLTKDTKIKHTIYEDKPCAAVQ